MDGAVLVILLVVFILVGAGGFFWWRSRSSGHVSNADAGMTTIAEAAPDQRPASSRSGRPKAAAQADLPPAKMAALEIVEGPNAIIGGMDVGKEIEVGAKRMTFGRNARQVDVQLYSLDEPSSVSRLHCTIEFNPGLNCFMITDEGSSSGTKVGGRPITPYQPHSLMDGDLIELGLPDKLGAVMRFSTTHNPPESGGRIRLDVGIQPKDTLRQHIGAIEGIRATSPLKSDVFLSYSRKDRELMRVIRKTLEEHHIIVWSDESLEPGAPSWRSDVQNAIENTRCVVAILSPDAKDSEWVNEELNYAKIRKARIFTILARGDESNAIPFGMTGVQWIDMRTDFVEGIQELVYEKATARLVASINEFLGRG
ncbi:MAG: TIR domain-containing protein [Anaerolineae bacterium]|nr:TIR domain-containing protein [Anaerolineae bacterium]